MTVLIAHKDTTEDRSNTTVLANDTDLVVAMAANTTYIVEGYIGTYSRNLSTVRTASQWDFTIPAGATGSYGFFGHDGNFNAGNGIRFYNGGGAALAWTTNVSLFGTSTSYVRHWIMGTIVTSGTAGNLQFRWAQTVSQAAVSQIFAGSHLMLTSV